jgi:hypothetical protein
VDGFDRKALANSADVDPGYVDRLMGLGILDARDDLRFSRGDLRRVRLVRALEEGGLPLDGIATAIGKGDLSFGFLDLVSWEWYGGFVDKTYRELSEESGIDLDLLRVIRE